MNVRFSPETLGYFEDLVIILFQKKYFSFLDASKKYVGDLIDDILQTLPTRLHKPAPPYFDRYGKGLKYAMFRKNKQTAWYVFFTTHENEKIYLVQYIANNHTIAQYL